LGRRGLEFDGLHPEPVAILRREYERRSFDDAREPELPVTVRPDLGTQRPVTRLQNADPGNRLPLVIDDLAGDGSEAVEDDVRDAPIAAGECLRLRPD